MSSGGEIGKKCQYFRCVAVKMVQVDVPARCLSLYLVVYHPVRLCHPQILSVMDAVLWLQLLPLLTPPFLHVSPDLFASRIDARLDL